MAIRLSGGAPAGPGSFARTPRAPASPTSGSASGGFIGQAASSASATAVSAAIRAAFLLLPSITRPRRPARVGPFEHVLRRREIIVAPGAIAEILGGHLPALPGMVEPGLQPLVLRLLGDVEEQLDDRGAVVALLGLELVDLVIGAAPFRLAWRSPRPARPGPGRTSCGRTPRSRRRREASSRSARGSGAPSPPRSAP